MSNDAIKTAVILLLFLVVGFVLGYIAGNS
jgi:hypothetical protein